MTEDSIQRLEAALLAAVAAQGTALKAETARTASRFELRFLLARLGVAAEERDAIDAAASALDLTPDLRASLSRRLLAEAQRLSRLARAASPAYDVNRHIAVRRALLWAQCAPADLEAAPPRLSGRELNRRFRRSGGHPKSDRRTRMQDGPVMPRIPTCPGP